MSILAYRLIIEMLNILQDFSQILKIFQDFSQIKLLTVIII